MGEKQAISKLREDGKSIRAIAQPLAIARTTIWNVLKKKETTGVLSNRCWTGRWRKTSAVDDKLLWEKNPETTVSDITNNSSIGVYVYMYILYNIIGVLLYIWNNCSAFSAPLTTVCQDGWSCRSWVMYLKVSRQLFVLSYKDSVTGVWSYSWHKSFRSLVSCMLICCRVLTTFCWTGLLFCVLATRCRPT